jgi:hypothetical protein
MRFDGKRDIRSIQVRYLEAISGRSSLGTRNPKIGNDHPSTSAGIFIATIITKSQPKVAIKKHQKAISYGLYIDVRPA